MVSSLYASILAWSCFPLPEALSTSHPAENATLSAETLDTTFIPSGLRRRCSTLTKVTLAVAHATVRDRDLPHVPTVFSSAHGESEITAGLLGDLGNDQPLSPIGFSLSVHNAASGLFSIATGNTAPSTAIAAGESSLVMGLCEALLTAAEAPEIPVLYVCSDEQVPAVFLPEGISRDRPFAIAMLLRSSKSSDGHSMKVAVRDAASDTDSSRISSSTVESVQSFVGWLNDATPSVRLNHDSSVWHCEGLAQRSHLFRSPLRK